MPKDILQYGTLKPKRTGNSGCFWLFGILLFVLLVMVAGAIWGFMMPKVSGGTPWMP